MSSFQHISSLPFKQWIWQDKENRLLLLSSLFIMTISFAWLKYLYPYPNFMPPDSYNYLEAAENNEFINFWPIGYSKFLRLISVFTRSHFLLVIAQYTFLVISVLYFLFTIRYLLSPGKWIFRIIVIVSIVNPLLVHIANFISSDALFATLSLVWLTQLIWIIYKPTRALLLFHAVIVLVAFTVRFAAIYYPCISILVIFILVNPRTYRYLGIGSILFLIFSFIGLTQQEYYQKSRKIQYTAFGGWQLAANGLYGYAFDEPDPIEAVPLKYRQIHTIVNKHMDSVRKLSVRPDIEPGIYYLWNFKSPLRILLTRTERMHKKEKFFNNWAAMAPLYNEYGRWLIQKHFSSFILHFVWPNLKFYYNPPSSFMGYYNLGNKNVDPVAVKWFNWENNQLPIRSKDAQIHIMNQYPVLLTIINPLFILFSLSLLLFSVFKTRNVLEKQITTLVLFIWFSNLFFSVLSAPIELRYQVFSIIITIPFLLLFIEWVAPLLNIYPSINKEKTSLVPKITNDSII